MELGFRPFRWHHNDVLRFLITAITESKASSATDVITELQPPAKSIIMHVSAATPRRSLYGTLWEICLQGASATNGRRGHDVLRFFSAIFRKGRFQSFVVLQCRNKRRQLGFQPGNDVSVLSIPLGYPH